MSVVGTAYPVLHAMAQRDRRDPHSYASWSVGVVGDVSGGSAFCRAQLARPNLVLLPIYVGMVADATSMSANAGDLRFYETWPGLGAGVSRNINVDSITFNRASGSTANVNVIPHAHGRYPLIVAVDPATSAFVVCEGIMANQNGVSGGLNLHAWMWDAAVFSVPGGPRLPML